MFRRTTKAERAWLNQIAEWACAGGLDTLGLPYEQFHIHHCAGHSAKHNKLKIGPYFCLPIPIQLHDVHSNHPWNITHHRKAFVQEYGTEKQLFATMCQDMKDKGIKLPFGPEVEAAIEDYHL